MSGVAGRAGLVVPMLLLVAAGTQADEYDPFQVPRERVRTSVQTIALRPVVLPDETEHANDVRARIERAVTEFLTNGGFTVVGSSAFESLWRRMTA